MSYTNIGKILTHWYKFEQWLLKQFKLTTKQQIDQYVETLKLEVPTQYKKIYNPILENSKGYVLTCRDASGKYKADERFMKFKERTQVVEQACDRLYLTKLVLDKVIEPLDAIVGIQPLTGPVGLIYCMQWKDKEALQNNILTEDGQSKHVTLQVMSQAVEAGSRKLATGFTIEAVQDLKVQGLEYKKDLYEVLSSQIASEYFGEVIQTIRNMVPESQEYELYQKDKSLEVQAIEMVTKVNGLCNQIAKDTRRGSGNVIVIHDPAIYSLLLEYADKISLIKFKDMSKQQTHLMSPQVVTEANSPIKVVLHYDNTSDITIGYKGGNGQTDAGLFNCPYVMVVDMGITVDVNTFQPVQQFATRFGSSPHSDGALYFKRLSIKIPKIEEAA